MSILIGLDIGGTTTHGLRAEDGRPVQEVVGGSANVQNVSPAQASRPSLSPGSRTRASQWACCTATANGWAPTGCETWSGACR